MPFKDVDSSAWYSDSIGSAYAVGLITGYTDGTFRPDGIISRQELAVMLTKASKLLSLKADNGGSRNAYKDESSFGSFAKDSIDFVTSAGLYGRDGIERLQAVRSIRYNDARSSRYRSLQAAAGRQADLAFPALVLKQSEHETLNRKPDTFEKVPALASSSHMRV